MADFLCEMAEFWEMIGLEPLIYDAEIMLHVFRIDEYSPQNHAEFHS